MSRQVLQLVFQAIAVWRRHSSLSGTATRVLVGPPPCKRGDLACDLWGPLSIECPSCGVASSCYMCRVVAEVYIFIALSQISCNLYSVVERQG